MGLKLACTRACQTGNSDHPMCFIFAHAPAPARFSPAGLACLYSATRDPQFADLGLKCASAVIASTPINVDLFMSSQKTCVWTQFCRATRRTHFATCDAAMPVRCKVMRVAINASFALNSRILSLRSPDHMLMSTDCDPRFCRYAMRVINRHCLYDERLATDLQACMHPNEVRL